MLPSSYRNDQLSTPTVFCLSYYSSQGPCKRPAGLQIFVRHLGLGVYGSEITTWRLSISCINTVRDNNDAITHTLDKPI